MKKTKHIPLALGGHTFISQLGNEPMPDADTQTEIVRACLDSGIRTFDTTHRPEREGLGRALEALGRRDEATIIAWNFFDDVGTGPEDKLDPAALYQPHHIGELLEQLRTDHIDLLVVHRVPGGVEIRKQQEELTLSWKEQGLVRSLGVWEPGPDVIEEYGRENPYDFMVAPLNVATAEKAAPSFERSKELGWRTFAVSPFIRGWELDKMVERALAKEGGEESAVRARLADLMLRFSLFHPHVDVLVTAMRRVEWVTANVESWRRGPLTDDECAWLDGLGRG